MANKIDFKLASPEQVISNMGTTLAQIRLSRNISQEELASMAGISPRTLSRLESGENSSLDTLVRLMQALQLHNHLASLLPDPGIQPVQQFAQKGATQKRVRKSTVKKSSDKAWTWDEGETP